MIYDVGLTTKEDYVKQFTTELGHTYRLPTIYTMGVDYSDLVLRVPNPQLNHNPAYYLPDGPRNEADIIDGARASYERILANVLDSRMIPSVARAIYKCNGVENLSERVYSAIVPQMTIVQPDDYDRAIREQMIDVRPRVYDNFEALKSKPEQILYFCTPWRLNPEKSGAIMFDQLAKVFDRTFHAKERIVRDGGNQEQLRILSTHKQNKTVMAVLPNITNSLHSLRQVLSTDTISEINILTDTIQGGLEVSKLMYGIFMAIANKNVNSCLRFNLSSAFVSNLNFLEPLANTLVKRVAQVKGVRQLDFNIDFNYLTPSWDSLDFGVLNAFKSSLLSALQFPHGIAGTVRSVGSANLPSSLFPNPPMVSSGLDKSLLLKDRIGREI